MRKWVVVFLVVAAIGVLAYAQRGSIASRMFAMGIERNLQRDVAASVPDGLHVALCGAGSPLPDPKRSGPCVVVIAGPTTFLVDAGTGGARNLGPMGIRAGKIEAVFLTHFHSDHIDGIGELSLVRWVGAANTSPLPVYGPPGVGEIVSGFNRAYAQDQVYRTAHHGDAVAPPSGAGLVSRPFVIPGGSDDVEVWNRDGVTITAFTVEHSPVHPAVGYRFDYGGRSLVLSGDTSKSKNLEAHAQGVDLLVHEALDDKLVALMREAAKSVGNAQLEKIFFDIPGYHTTPVEAAEIATSAKVGALLYYHIAPTLPLPGLEAAFLDGVDDVYDGPVVLGRDGTFVSLPRGSDAIDFSNLF